MTNTPREFIERAGDNRTGLYVERIDWQESYFVTKNAVTPVAIRRWWADTTTSWETFAFCDLGYFTSATTSGIALAADAANLGWVCRHNWSLTIGDLLFDWQKNNPSADVHPREGNQKGCFTRGLIDVTTGQKMDWPNVGWLTYVNSDHFEHAPKS